MYREAVSPLKKENGKLGSTRNGRGRRQRWRRRGGDQPVRARPLAELVLKTFERHPLGSQSFVPLSGKPYLVAVAPAGKFDVERVRLFRAEGHHGVRYAKGTWHHFLLVLEAGGFPGGGLPG